MFGKIAAWLGKAVLVVMAGVGVLAVVLVWQLADFFKGWNDKPKKEPATVVQVQAAEPLPVVGSVDGEKTVPESNTVQAAALASDCACVSGAECVGPRGGKYCLDGAGKKKYKSQP